MTCPRSGDTVIVHYTGRLDDGRVFDSSREREPLELTVGDQQVIPGFEDALTQMESGESKTVTVPADRAYGPHRPELVIAIDREEFPANVELEVGQRVQLKPENGPLTVVKIAELTEQQVMLDANHPLAGQDLTFELELVEILPARS